MAIWEILNSSLQLHQAQNLQAPQGFHSLFAAREGGGLSSFFISSLILPHLPPAPSRPLPVHLTRGVSQSERGRSCYTSTTTAHFYYLTWSITIRTEEEETPASASFPTARLIFCFLNLIFYSSRDIAICGMKSSYRVSNKQARRTMPRELQSRSFTTLPSPSPCQGPRCPQGPQCPR